jgi:predicted MPP superfamily phosphohydrolase
MQSPLSRRRLLRWIASSAGIGWASSSQAASTRAKRVDEAVTVRRVSIELPHLPPGLDGFRIVQISDLHLEPFTKPHHIEETVKVCRSLSPDLIAITGDFVTHDTGSMGLLGELLAPLQAPSGIFACLGNHDFWSGHDEVIKVLKVRGIPTLRNEMRLIHTDGGLLPLAGMDTRYMGEPNIRATLSTLKPDQPLVMMMHEPDVADDLAEAGVPALQISGHTHGGLVRLMGKPPSRLRRARWGREYIAGRYQVGPVQLYVNQGIGCIGVPVRIHCPPEVTEITLRSPELRSGATA